MRSVNVKICRAPLLLTFDAFQATSLTGPEHCVPMDARPQQPDA
jgi:hypothetical protein